MQTALDRLNPQQRRAVTTIDGPLLIIAGAGSGKTGVITSRIAWMVSQGIDPESILALTFTNKAATEMRDRVRELLGGAGARDAAHKVTLSTFHAFGLSILRRYGRQVGYRPHFTIYDTGDQQAALKEAAREIRIDPEDLDLFGALQAISAIKTGRWQPNDERVALIDDPARMRALADSYREHLLSFNAVDFDDLIVQPLAVLREHESARSHYTDRFRYILVDEFQDTSTLQYELLHEIAREWRNVCVVGDDDQSIYSWRGADFSNIQRFERDYPERVEITLDRNYRSTGRILEAANAVIANNTARKHKELWTDLEDENLIELTVVDSDDREAEWIAEKIKLLAWQEGISYDGFGVLIRTNAQARAIEEALLEADIPYSISGGMSFFDRKEIRDVLAYLRVIINPDDNVNLLRTINTPRRGIGRRTVDALHDIAEEHKTSLYGAVALVATGEYDPGSRIGKAARAAIEDYRELVESYSERFTPGAHLENTVTALVGSIDYWSYLVQEYSKSERTAKAKWKNIGYLMRSVQRYESNPDVIGPDLEGFLTRVTLQNRDEQQESERGGRVSLMTIHSAKGLEFDFVFLAGTEADILPHRRSVEERDGDVEEERRLFYVAITRARRRLYISSCRSRQVQGELVEAVPSPFLEEIPPALIVTGSGDASDGIAAPADPFAAMRQRLGD